MSDQSKVAGSSAAPGLPVAYCEFNADGYVNPNASDCMDRIAGAFNKLEEIRNGSVDCTTVVLSTASLIGYSFILVCKVSSSELLRLLEGRKSK